MSTAIQENLIFLTYNSRSGSTFLSQLLNEYSDITVGLEANIPDGMVYGPYCINAEESLEKYLDEIYNNEKFKSWEINRSELKNELISIGKFPISFIELLQILLKLYFKDDPAKVWIHKCGHYIRFHEKIRKQLPNTKFVYVNRDPRAIFNSQKNSINSYTGLPMHTNPGIFLHEYKATHNYIIKYKKANWLHIIDYENLIKNPDNEVSNLLKFLEVSNEKNIKEDYYLKIPAKQKHLHKNLQSDPIQSRMNSWKYKLNNFEIVFLQYYLKKELKFHAYPLVETSSLSTISLLKFMYYSVSFFYLENKMKIRNYIERYKLI